MQDAAEVRPVHRSYNGKTAADAWAEKNFQVHSFGEHLGQIVGDEESVTPEGLVRAPQLGSVTILKDKMIFRAGNQD